MDEHTDSTIAYLHEYYNPNAQIVEAGKWNDKTIWQVITESEEQIP